MPCGNRWKENVMQADEDIRSILKRTPAGVPTFTGDLERVKRRARARRIRKVSVAGLVLAVLGTGVVVPLALLGRLGGSPHPERPVGSIGTPIVLERISVESGAVAVAVGEDAAWVAGFNRVARIDPATNQVVATIRTPQTGDYSEVAVGEGSVWVTASGLVYRIDPAENAVVATIEVGEYPQDIAVGGGWVWVTRAKAGPGDLVKIDPGTNRVAGAPIALGYGPGPFVYHDGALWIVNTGLTVGELKEPVDFDAPTTVRIDAATGEVTPIGGPAGAPEAVGAGAVWGVASGELLSPGTVGGDAVIRVDPQATRVTAVIPVERAQGVAFGDGMVWVMTTPPSTDPHLFIPKRSHPGTLVLIDPATNTPVGDPLPVPGLQPIDLATGEGSAWVADYNDGTVTRVGLDE
jgi:YVTN family beta-propeller protein